MRRVWPGRCRDRTWQAFVALAGELVSTGEMVRRIWPRLSRHRPAGRNRMSEARRRAKERRRGNWPERKCPTEMQARRVHRRAQNRRLAIVRDGLARSRRGGRQNLPGA
jgi:hypothetical protein